MLQNSKTWLPRACEVAAWIDDDDHHCALIQSCTFCEGSTAYLLVECVAQ